MTRVLLIEHDPTARDRLALALRQARLEVRSAGDAANALALVRECHPCVVVARADMRDLPLATLVEAIRNEPTAAHAGIVAMVSGSVDAALAPQDSTDSPNAASTPIHSALLAGADETVQQPVDTTDLLRAINACARRAADSATIITQASAPDAVHAALRNAQRPATLVMLELEDAAAVAATAGIAAANALDDAWRKRVRSLAPATASVLSSPRGEVLVILPPHTPHLRALLTAFCGTGQAPVLVAGRDLRLRASAGMLNLPADEALPDPEVLLQRCRFALQAARRAGHPRVRSYCPDDAVGSLDNLQLATLLQHALEGGGFRLLYQPKVSIASGEISGAEALIRWTVPSTGEPVPAKTLLEVAEDAGLIDEIGGWALRDACRQCAQWCADGMEIPVSVNIAPTQFRRGDLVDEVRLALRESGIPGRLLMVEVQESVLHRDTGEVREQLEAIRVSGVRVALDDFGTGIESLSLLRRFPLDEMKVDHSIVTRLPGSVEDRATMDIALRHARGLGISCVGVGVERAAQMAFLSERGWDGAQGWHISKPLRGEEITRFARREAAALARAADAID